MNARHYIFSIDDDRHLPGGTQRYMEGRAVFGNVDLVSTKHGFDMLLKLTLLGQLNQKPQRLGSDAVFGVIEVNSGSFGSQLVGALRSIREKFGKMEFAYFLLVRLKGFPRSPLLSSDSWAWCQLTFPLAPLLLSVSV